MHVLTTATYKGAKFVKGAQPPPPPPQSNNGRHIIEQQNIVQFGDYAGSKSVLTL